MITAFQPGILDKFLTIGPGKLNIQGMYEGFLLATNNFSITTKDDINNILRKSLQVVLKNRQSYLESCNTHQVEHF